MVFLVCVCVGGGRMLSKYLFTYVVTYTSFLLFFFKKPLFVILIFNLGV